MIIQNKADDAVVYFNEGLNCCQAVLTSCCEEFGLDKKTAINIASGFGAGMGRLQGTCGAVTGAYMLIGLKYGGNAAADRFDKDKVYSLIRGFAKSFSDKNKSTECRKLLNVDLVNGDSQVVSEHVQTICPQMIRDAVEILKDIVCEPD